MTQAEGDDGLCVAHGKPVRVLSTFDANEVRGMIEQAHEWSKQGLYHLPSKNQSGPNQVCITCLVVVQNWVCITCLVVD